MLEVLSVESIKQYPIVDYKIDLYLPEYNIAIEFDEYHHNKSKDKIREDKIRQAIDCKFVRISDDVELGTAIGLVIKNLKEQK